MSGIAYFFSPFFLLQILNRLLHANIHITSQETKTKWVRSHSRHKHETMQENQHHHVTWSPEREREEKKGGRRGESGHSAFKPFDKQCKNMNTYRYILCEHSAPSCPEIRRKTLSTRTHSEHVRQFEVRIIDDLRKSNGLHSVSAYGHGPVYLGPCLRVLRRVGTLLWARGHTRKQKAKKQNKIRNADQALTVRGEHADRIVGSPSW